MSYGSFLVTYTWMFLDPRKAGEFYVTNFCPFVRPFVRPFVHPS